MVTQRRPLLAVNHRRPQHDDAIKQQHEGVDGRHIDVDDDVSPGSGEGRHRYRLTYLTFQRKLLEACSSDLLLRELLLTEPPTSSGTRGNTTVTAR